MHFFKCTTSAEFRIVFLCYNLYIHIYLHTIKNFLYKLECKLTKSNLKKKKSLELHNMRKAHKRRGRYFATLTVTAGSEIFLRGPHSQLPHLEKMEDLALSSVCATSVVISPCDIMVVVAWCHSFTDLHQASQHLSVSSIGGFLSGLPHS